MHAGTIVSHHYLAHARTVAQSFLAHNPGSSFTAVVVGDLSEVGDEPFEVLTEHDLGAVDLERRRRRYDDFEYAVSFKPTLLRRLLERDRLALYLDADLYVVDRLNGIEEGLGAASIGLTPHLVRPLPEDGLQPRTVSILRAGAFNTGFVAVRATEEAEAFLRWWEERLVTGSKVDPGRGYFVDQRWIDLVPGMFDGVEIIRDPAWNLGHWNLVGQELSRSDEGWRLGERPLRIFHFSGFDPDHPGRLSKHQNRIQMKPDSAIAALCREYAQAMLANGYHDVAGGGRNTYHGRTIHHLILPLLRRRDLLRARLRRG